MPRHTETKKGQRWRPVLRLGLILLLVGSTVACEQSTSGPASSAQPPATEQHGEQTALPPGTTSAQASQHRVVVYFFWGDGCPHCEREKPFLEQLARRHPQLEVKMYEVWHDRENANLFEKMAKAYGITVSGVPATFIGDFEPIIGYADYMADDIENKIKYCLDQGCVDPGEKASIEKGGSTVPPTPTPGETETSVRLPILGEIDLSSMSLYLTTTIIAFVDGFNPCSLWLISLLLALVISSGSRKKVLSVGVTFLLVTATAYGVFMLGLLSVFRYVGYMGWIQVVVALVALTFGIVNIKDYFWLKKGISLTIPDRYKPRIFADMRNIMKGDKSTWAMIGGTAVMALGVALVELPCTAGFPVIWTNIIAQHDVGTFGFVLLFALYLLIYLLDELGVVVPTAIVLRGSRFDERHGRTLKLVGGTIMLALAFAMLIRADLMNEISGTLLVFGTAIAVSLVVMFVHRKVLPKYGIHIGSEKQ